MASHDSPEELTRAFLKGAVPCFCGSRVCLVGAQRRELDHALQFCRTAHTSADCSTSEDHPHAFSMLWAFKNPLNPVSGGHSTLSQWQRNHPGHPAPSTALAVFAQGYLERFPEQCFTITLTERAPAYLTRAPAVREINVAVSVTDRRLRDPNALHAGTAAERPHEWKPPAGCLSVDVSQEEMRNRGWNKMFYPQDARALTQTELEFVGKRRRLADAAKAAAGQSYATAAAASAAPMELRYGAESDDRYGHGEIHRAVLFAHVTEGNFRCTAGVVQTRGEPSMLSNVQAEVDTEAILSALGRTMEADYFDMKHPVSGPAKCLDSNWIFGRMSPGPVSKRQDPAADPLEYAARKHESERLPLCGRDACRAAECLFRKLDPMGARKAVAALRAFMGAADDEAVTATLRVERRGPCVSQAYVHLKATLRTLEPPPPEEAEAEAVRDEVADDLEDW